MAPREPWEDRAEAAVDREAERFVSHPRRTLARWALWIVTVSVAVGLFGGALHWVGPWGGEAGRVTGVENVKEQNTRLLDDWEQMQAAAENVCDVRVTAQGQDNPTLLEDPTVAYRATYRRIKADYDRRMANLFEAQAVRNLHLPSNLRGLPREAPTLQEATAAIC